MRVSTCIHKFFSSYLQDVRGVSPETIKAYRDTLKLLIPFAAQYHCVKVESLKINHLDFKMTLAFLNHLEKTRKNITRTRNQRLAAIKSLAKMIKLIYPKYSKTADRLIEIPQKLTQKNLIGYLTHEEVTAVFSSVKLNKQEGFRNYTILNLLYDSGARASEVTTLSIDDFDSKNKSLVIHGKGRRIRLVNINARTTDLLSTYIARYRKNPKPQYKHLIFINQKGHCLTRHGIYKLCLKYLQNNLSKKRLAVLNPVHSFRHSCAINMLLTNYSLTEIQNHLGHESLESTMIYLKLNISRKKEIQNDFIEYSQSLLKDDPKLNELLDWDNKKDILKWLDTL